MPESKHCSAPIAKPKLKGASLLRMRAGCIAPVNTTVLLSVKSNELFNCGRLIVPIVRKIYDVDMSIKNFIPETYYQCESDVGGIKLTVQDKFKESNKALEIANILNKEEAVVTDIIRKDVVKKPSRLFSLTTLQKYLNKKYKMKADEVLKICQNLYEKKYQTYPRTDAEYLSEEEKDKVKDILNALNDTNLIFKDKKSIFDTSKIEAHSAITPTTVIPKDLTDKEKIVYDTVSNRFKANFCKEDCILSTSEMIIKCKDYVERIVVSPNFTRTEPFANCANSPVSSTSCFPLMSISYLFVIIVSLTSC